LNYQYLELNQIMYKMAGNSKKGHRKGAVLNRSQSFNPKNKTWVKRDTKTGKIMAVKKEPFKGVRKKTTTK